MSFLSEVSLADDYGAFAAYRETFGFVPNLLRAQALLPRLIDAQVALETIALTKGNALRCFVFCSSKQFERLGSGKRHRINVRLVAATHRDLAEMVSRREFRSDLYYRLNVFPVSLPPLRERREDIPQLVSHFVELFSQSMGKRIDRVPNETLGAFISYAWPGNVRDLQNLVERALIRSNNGVLPNPLPMSPATAMPASCDGTLRDSERALILKALCAAKGMIGGPRGAAARLGIKRTTLVSKMKSLGMYRPRANRYIDEFNAASYPEPSFDSQAGGDGFRATNDVPGWIEKKIV